ncbi:MAG TPA: N-acetyl-alpha-D-glucosaminyl L-malate synthase BshA [Actinomycetota bacterium]|nr:N-acetyl-alpha-D-glucosaminyl L-malate synthase BshA [Actinomycetota bacterium]
MKIGIACHSSCGGSTRVALDLATEMSRRGHVVHVFSRGRPFGRWEGPGGPRYHDIQGNDEDDRNPAWLHTEWTDEEIESFMTMVAETVVAERIEVFHFHYGVPFAFFASDLKSRLGKAAPIVVGTLHGTDVLVHGADKTVGPRLGRALEDADALTTVSDSHKGLIGEIFGPQISATVIPNFVDMAKFRPLAASNGSSNGGGVPTKRAIAHVSNFRSVKNPARLIEIFQQVRARVDSELWLIGDGPEMENTKSLVQSAGLSGHVRLWGLHDDVSSLIQRTGVLLITSEHESFCLAALEAMASGVPVVAPAVGGLPELIESGESGLLYAPGDLAGAVHLIQRVLTDRMLSGQIVRGGLSKAAQYRQDKIVDVYESLYSSLIANRQMRLVNTVIS